MVESSPQKSRALAWALGLWLAAWAMRQFEGLSPESVVLYILGGWFAWYYALRWLGASGKWRFLLLVLYLPVAGFIGVRVYEHYTTSPITRTLHILEMNDWHCKKWGGQDNQPLDLTLTPKLKATARSGGKEHSVLNPVVQHTSHGRTTRIT